jgi:hypothetical protein
MTTTSQDRNLVWIATSVAALAFGLMVCANAFGQSPAAPPSSGAQQNAAAPGVAGADDMRLWSFGDCERRFPYSGTPERKECVRVVGSPEAAEARALRVCDVSHAADKEEAQRCKASYMANKVKAAQDGLTANATATPQAPPSEEVMRRVKAIGTAAVEEQRAAQEPAARIEEDTGSVPPAPEESSWKGTMMTVVLLALGVVFGINMRRRKQAQSA